METEGGSRTHRSTSRSGEIPRSSSGELCLRCRRVGAMQTGLAVGAALGAAACFALSSALQQRGAARAPRNTGHRLVLHLVRRPVWLGGLLAAVATVVLQTLALAVGELALIQPLMLLGLLFALPFSVMLEKCKPSLREWLWAFVLVVGLPLFIVAARPSPGPPLADDWKMLALGTGAAI